MTTLATMGAIYLIEAPATMTRILPIVQPVIVAAPAPVARVQPVVAADDDESDDEGEPAPRPRARAVQPHLDAACVIDDSSAACQWDDGFPAISSDGRTVAMKYSPSSEATVQELSVRFYDARSGTLLRSSEITAGPGYDDDDANTPVVVAERAARVNAALTAQQYRSMDLVPYVDPTADPDGGPGAPTAIVPRGFYDDLHVELAGDHMRLVEPAGLAGSAVDRVLLQRDIGVPNPRPHADPDTEGCAGWSTWSRAFAWDRASSTLAVTTMYRTGGCTCPDLPVLTVRRAPLAARADRRNGPGRADL